MTNATRYPRLFERLYGRPLLMLPDKAFAIERVFQSALGRSSEELRAKAFFDDSDPDDSSPDDDAPPYEISDGIAVIPVMGTLVQRASWLDALCGMTSYASIGFDFAQAEADPKVRGILLEIDSGGGEVNGCFDLVDQIAASTKPVWAVANEAAYSAAYAIASAADRIFMPRTAGVGSIGVIALHVDQSERDKKQGYSYTPIFAGDHKFDGNSYQPLPDDVKAAIQGDIDRLYQLFVSTVAANRSMTAEAVVATQADVFHTAAAIDLGLADDTGTMNDALALFSASLNDDPSGTRSTSRPMNVGFSTAAAAASEKEPAMDPKDTAANPANITPEALATARAEAETSGRATGAKEASSSERVRIAAILGSEEAKGRTDLASHLALETDMSAEAAVKMLAKAPKEAAAPAAAANPFAAAMGGVANPELHSDNGDERGGPGADQENADAAALAIRVAAHVNPALRKQAA